MEAATEAKKYDLDRVVRLVIALVCIAVAIYLINYLSSVLLPFLVGCVLAYMLNPIVEFFRKILFMKNR
ncbi:MAG: AI-2E family transporter, partial [Muribaculaceae bacterium]|nr:AI-2E family transporter [Muribaculaceae bacterium]